MGKMRLRANKRTWAFRLFLIVATGYFILAYGILPYLWERYERRHPDLSDLPTVTTTATGIPGDPLNVGLIGTEQGLMAAMEAAGWSRADPLGIKSDIEIAAAAVLDRPYADAPVSNLFLFGRKEDWAFEQAVHDSPRRRHHVRFWKSDHLDDQSRSLWIGSAIYDEHVGFSRTTGQVTHVTASAIDQERDKLISDLTKANQLEETFLVKDFQPVHQGYNGGGDPWHTDGSLTVGIIGKGTTE